jgi:hypothetical protein
VLPPGLGIEGPCPSALIDFQSGEGVHQVLKLFSVNLFDLPDFPKLLMTHCTD